LGHVGQGDFRSCSHTLSLRAGCGKWGLPAPAGTAESAHAGQHGSSRPGTEQGKLWLIVVSWQAAGPRTPRCPPALTAKNQRHEEEPDMPEQTRIVIVDDHPFVREGLKQLLAGQNDFALVAEASTAETAH